MFTATKLLWIARNQPEIINKTRYFVNFDSFIALQLGISPYMVNSLASRTMLYDIVKHSWVQEYCDFCQIDTTKMPPVVASGTYLGTTTEKAQSLNLPAGIKVIAGNHDQLCCSLGAGIVYPGSAMSSMGTTESMVTISPTLNLRNDLYQSSIPVYDYVIPGQYAYMTFLTSCASLLSWFKDDVLQTSGNFFQRFESEANSRQHLTKVLFLPYLLGSGTPSLNSKARGVFEGITIGHNAVDFYMAILQSISCEEKLNCENMEKSGIHIDQIRCIGGGAQSDLWLQLKAIFTNKEIVSLNSRETGCLGAALIAGVGSGIFADFKEACDNCISIKRIFAPLKQYQAEVDEYYAKYLKLRQNMLDFWNAK